MFCLDCDEPITGREIESGEALVINAGSLRDCPDRFSKDWMHRECLLRGVIGSVTHVRRECKFYGGTKDCHECEKDMTRREAARAAVREWKRLTWSSPN